MNFEGSPQEQSKVVDFESRMDEISKKETQLHLEFEEKFEGEADLMYYGTADLSLALMIKESKLDIDEYGKNNGLEDWKVETLRKLSEVDKQVLIDAIPLRGKFEALKKEKDELVTERLDKYFDHMEGEIKEADDLVSALKIFEEVVRSDTGDFRFGINAGSISSQVSDYIKLRIASLREMVVQKQK